MRLVDHLKARLVVVLTGDIGPLIAAGAVLVDGRVGRIDDPVDGTEVIDVEPGALSRVALRPESTSLSIAHEDDAVVVVDKPAGMHVHPLGSFRTGTLLNAMLWHGGARPDHPWGAWRPSPLHRLDRPVSGLIAFGKGAARVGVSRRYQALVVGELAHDCTIDAPLGRDPALDYRRAIVGVEAGGQEAITHVTVVERRRGTTLVELTIETGRTHQIRAHLASIGHPIAGDTLYTPGGTRSDATETIALHACELRLRHSTSAGEIVARSVSSFAQAAQK